MNGTSATFPTTGPTSLETGAGEVSGSVSPSGDEDTTVLPSTTSDTLPDESGLPDSSASGSDEPGSPTEGTEVVETGSATLLASA